MSKSRIRPEFLGPVHDVIFGENRVSGPAVSKAAGFKNVTLWSYLTRTGLPVGAVDALADVLTARAARLMNAASALRQLASSAERAAPVIEQGGSRP